MKRCEKLGFKTGEEMIDTLYKDNIILEIRCNIYCPNYKNNCSKKNLDKTCNKALIDYLNQEIETNFEHYKKEFIEIVNKINAEKFIKNDWALRSTDFTYFMADCYKNSKTKTPFSIWLNEEYKQ